MEYQVVTQPAAEPITLHEALEHLRLVYVAGVSFEQDRIKSLITAARQMVERVTGLAMCPQVIQARASSSYCCGPLVLPMAAPLRSITSLGYTDGGGILNPVAYRVDDFAKPARLFPENWGTSWPWIGSYTGQIDATYEVGFDAPETVDGTRPVPETLKQAMLLLIGHWYENREAVTVGVAANELPLGIEYLVRSYRQHVGL